MSNQKKNHLFIRNFVVEIKQTFLQGVNKPNIFVFDKGVSADVPCTFSFETYGYIFNS